MTLYDYNKLGKEMQARMLYREGVYLLARKETPYIYMLYQIDGFYVEGRFDSGLNEMLGIHSFTTTELLEPYLDKIIIKI